MKNQIKIYLLVIICSFSLFSCEKTIDFKGSITDPLLVVNSIVQPDSTVVVLVTQSEFFLSSEYSFLSISDADVKLYINGNFVEKLAYKKLGNGYSATQNYGFCSHYQVQVGDKLRIEVSAPNFDPVWCEQKVPDPVRIIAIDTVTVTNNTDYGDSSERQFSLTFKDPAGEKNYYRVLLFYNNGAYNYQLNIASDDMIFSTTDVSSIATNDYYTGEYLLFSDEMIDGKEYTLKFTPDNSTDNFNGAFHVYLESLSHDYYMYLRTTANNREGNPFAEPTQIYNNIHGGIGILGAFSVSEKIIKMEGLNNSAWSLVQVQNTVTGEVLAYNLSNEYIVIFSKNQITFNPYCRIPYAFYVAGSGNSIRFDNFYIYNADDGFGCGTINDWENRLHTHLANAERYEIENDILKIHCSNGFVLTFKVWRYYY